MTERTFEINIEDHMGFLRFYMGRGEPTGELTPFLSGSLAQWMDNNPHQCIVAVTPLKQMPRSSRIQFVDERFSFYGMLK